MALIVEDPDSADGSFIHWLAYNIPPTDHITEGTAPGTQMKNGFGQRGYAGPCPSQGTHRYVFKVFALDSLLDIDPNGDKATLERAMHGHVLAHAELAGRYSR